jgi:hypothetical protein
VSENKDGKGYCFDCEVELTDDNTEEFGGFDGGNYLASRGFGNGSDKDFFMKCDSCFNADIDRYEPRY